MREVWKESKRLIRKQRHLVKKEVLMKRTGVKMRKKMEEEGASQREKIKNRAR